MFVYVCVYDIWWQNGSLTHKSKERKRSRKKTRTKRGWNVAPPPSHTIKTMWQIRDTSQSTPTQEVAFGWEDETSGWPRGDNIISWHNFGQSKLLFVTLERKLAENSPAVGWKTHVFNAFALFGSLQYLDVFSITIWKLFFSLKTWKTLWY